MRLDQFVLFATGGLGLFLALALAHGLRVIGYARSPRRRLYQRLSQLRR